MKYQRVRVKEENKKERKKYNHEEKKFKFDEISELRDRALLIQNTLSHQKYQKDDKKIAEESEKNAIEE